MFLSRARELRQPRVANLTCLADAIHEFVLIQHVHGLGLPQTAGSQYLDDSRGVHFPTSLFNHGYSVPHVTTKGDECTMVHRRGLVDAASLSTVGMGRCRASLESDAWPGRGLEVRDCSAWRGRGLMALRILSHGLVIALWPHQGGSECHAYGIAGQSATSLLHTGPHGQGTEQWRNKVTLYTSASPRAWSPGEVHRESEKPRQQHVTRQATGADGPGWLPRLWPV